MRERDLLEKGYRKYTGRTIDVFFNKDMCIKSGNCVRGDSNVFNPSNRPWINADAAPKEKVLQVVESCPSSALQYILKEEVDFIYKEGKFYIEDDGYITAEITFTKAGKDIIIIDHTFVDEKCRGKGIALKLVERVIKYAIDNDKKIVPLCPYAKSVFDKSPSLSGVLHK